HTYRTSLRLTQARQIKKKKLKLFKQRGNRQRGWIKVIVK
ncbi:unnamed protein product, partial [Plutella xylostella]